MTTRPILPTHAFAVAIFTLAALEPRAEGQALQSPSKIAVDASVTSINNRFGVLIHYSYDRDAYFCDAWRRAPCSADGMQIDLGQAARTIEVVERFFARYPINMIRDIITCRPKLIDAAAHRSKVRQKLQMVVNLYRAIDPYCYLATAGDIPLSVTGRMGETAQATSRARAGSGLEVAELPDDVFVPSSSGVPLGNGVDRPAAPGASEITLTGPTTIQVPEKVRIKIIIQP